LLEDGTTVYCSATTSGGIRGESATCVYWDEVCFVSTKTLQQSFFQSILPTIDTMGGGFICSSTPNYHDLFWEIWCRTQPEHSTYDPKWRLEEIKWEESYDLASGELKLRDNEWKEQRIRELGGAGKTGLEVFMQEYGNSFDIQAGLIKFFNQTTVNRFVEKTLELYNVIVYNYKELYDVNKGQNVDSTHLNGISNVLKQINNLIETKNCIENEINNMLELAEAENREKEEKKETSIDSEGGIRGDKESILNLIDGGKIKESK